MALVSAITSGTDEVLEMIASLTAAARRALVGTMLASCGVWPFGCSSKSRVELAVATGIVTNGNQPVANVRVTFIPEQGPLAHGVTGEDGTFRLSSGTRPGVAPGKSTVVLSTGAANSTTNLMAREHQAGLMSAPAAQKTALDRLPCMKHGKPSPPQSPLETKIPPQYTAVTTSDLTFVIKLQGVNHFLIQLAN